MKEADVRPVESPDLKEQARNAISQRELQVLQFIVAGFSNKEVARRLGLSVRTVETHRLNLRKKTKAGRLHELIKMARDLNLDPVD